MNVESNRELTPREKEIVQLVAEGMTNQEAGAALGISTMVVKNHLRVIFDKCGVWTRLELALWYVKRVTARPEH